MLLLVSVVEMRGLREAATQLHFITMAVVAGAVLLVSCSWYIGSVDLTKLLNVFGMATYEFSTDE